jgi:hypothetical protein
MSFAFPAPVEPTARGKQSLRPTIGLEIAVIIGVVKEVTDSP